MFRNQPISPPRPLWYECAMNGSITRAGDCATLRITREAAAAAMSRDAGVDPNRHAQRRPALPRGERRAMDLGLRDLRKIEHELSTAVAEEEHRVRVDEMKKRAITTAGSYDEFKNLVACADLKPVSGKAIQTELLEPRRGFIPGSGLVRGAESEKVRVGRRRRAGGDDDATVATVASADASSALAASMTPADEVPVWTKAPTSPAEFERDWRRCSRGVRGPSRAQLRYLRFVDPSVLHRLFLADIDVTLLESIVAALAVAPTLEPDWTPRESVLILSSLVLDLADPKKSSAKPAAGPFVPSRKMSLLSHLVPAGTRESVLRILDEAAAVAATTADVEEGAEGGAGGGGGAGEGAGGGADADVGHDGVRASGGVVEEGRVVGERAPEAEAREESRMRVLRDIFRPKGKGTK